MKSNQIRNGLILFVIILFLFSSVTPIVFANNAKSTKSAELDRQLENLAFYCATPNGFNNAKYEHYKQQLINQYSSKNINHEIDGIDEYEVTTINTESESTSLSLGPMDSPWPMQSHDVHHTGQSSYSTADNPGVEKWRFRCGWLEDTPVIDSDGVIYFGDNNRYLYAINPDGTKKWNYKLNGVIWGSSPAIAEDGTIYVGSWDTRLYAINPDGSLKWATGSGGSIFSSPIIADDGTIYFGTMSSGNSIVAMNPNGTKKWSYRTDDSVTSDPCIADDGTVYIGSNDNYLYALYPNGTLHWRFQTGDDIRGSVSIAEDGTIYVGSYDTYVYAINPDGTQKWKCYIGYGIATNPSIGNDGTIYVGGGKLYAILPNGTRSWSFDIGVDGHIDSSSPAISSDGTIYVGTNIGGPSDGGEIIAINPDGTERWRKRIANKWVESSPSIAEDGTIYIGSTYDMGSGYLHAFGIGDFEADANGPYYGIINEPVQFTGSARNGTEPYSWLWSFGDEDTSTVQNPMHMYTTAGTYTVNLTVTDDTDNVTSDTTWAKIKESNNPPNKPSITGPTHGKTGTSYDYTFVTTDPDDDEFVFYYIDWDDGSNTGWFGPYIPGENVVKSHSWNEENTYTIKCKAKDNYGTESDWGTLDVSIPRNRIAGIGFFIQFLQSHPNLFPLIRFLLKI